VHIGAQKHAHCFDQVFLGPVFFHNQLRLCFSTCATVAFALVRMRKPCCVVEGLNEF